MTNDCSWHLGGPQNTSDGFCGPPSTVRQTYVNSVFTKEPSALRCLPMQGHTRKITTQAILQMPSVAKMEFVCLIRGVEKFLTFSEAVVLVTIVITK